MGTGSSTPRSNPYRLERLMEFIEFCEKQGYNNVRSDTGKGSLMQEAIELARVSTAGGALLPKDRWVDYLIWRKEYASEEAYSKALVGERGAEFEELRLWAQLNPTISGEKKL